MHRFTSRTFLLVATLGLIGGCSGSNNSAQETTDPPPIARTAKPAPVAATPEPSPAPSSNPALELLDMENLKEQILATEVLTELPDDLPDNFPVPEGLTIMTVTDASDTGALAYHAQIPGTPDEVAKQYRDMAKESGWELTEENAHPPLIMMGFEDGEKRLNVIVIDDASGTTQVSVTHLENIPL